MDPLVTTEWLAAELGARDLRIADATLLDPGLGRDARAEYETGHVPGAVFLDLAELRDTDSTLPNMLPPIAKAASRLGRLGLGDGTRIILYDDSPWKSAARAWWLIRSHNIGEVAILDGGLAKWRAEGRPLESGAGAARSRHATPRFDPRHLRTIHQIRANLDSQAEQLVDARSPGRFTGAEGDPHGAAPGHIPGSHNVHYATLFNPDGTYKRGEALAAAFAAINLDRPIVTTCGSGVTAATLAFALHLLGRDAALYDGSWSEWGGRADTPKALTPITSGDAA